MYGLLIMFLITSSFQNLIQPAFTCKIRQQKRKFIFKMVVCAVGVEFISELTWKVIYGIRGFWEWSCSAGSVFLTKEQLHVRQQRY